MKKLTNHFSALDAHALRPVSITRHVIHSTTRYFIIERSYAANPLIISSLFYRKQRIFFALSTVFSV